MSIALLGVANLIFYCLLPNLRERLLSHSKRHFEKLFHKSLTIALPIEDTQDQGRAVLAALLLAATACIDRTPLTGINAPPTLHHAASAFPDFDCIVLFPLYPVSYPIVFVLLGTLSCSSCNALHPFLTFRYSIL